MGVSNSCSQRGFHILRSISVNQWAPLIQVQKQCVKKCRECSFHTRDSAQDFEQGFFLQGIISREDIEYQPLCHTLRFSKSEKAACNNDSCPSKKRKPTTDGDPRPVHDFFYGLRAAPPILVIHCKPYQFLVESANGEMVGHVSGKVTRLEHSLAVSSYPDGSLDPETINWTFYHLYGVILRKGNTGFTGHYVCAFEQPQMGRWLYFNDYVINEDSEDYVPPEDIYGAKNNSWPIEVTTSLTLRQLDDKIEDMLKRDWRIFMVMYRKLFQVPVQLLKKITFPSSVIALQDHQSLEESGELEPEPEPEQSDDQEEYFTPEIECVGDEDLFGLESDSGQATGKTQGAADDEQPQGSPSELETRYAQAGQPMQTGLPAEQNIEVEADLLLNISSPSEPGHAEQSLPTDLSTEKEVEVEANSESFTATTATEQKRDETHRVTDNVSERDTSDSKLQTGQVQQPLPTDLPTEQAVEVEADLELNTSLLSGTGQAQRPSLEDQLAAYALKAETLPDLDTSSPSDPSEAQQPLPTDSPTEQALEAEAYLELDIASPSETSRAQQPLPTDLPEESLEVEAGPDSSITKPDFTNTGNGAQAEKGTQNDHQVTDENEQSKSSDSISETAKTEVEPSVESRKKQAKGNATKRTHDKALDEEEGKSTSVKRAKTDAKSSTQPKRKETKSKATKKTKKDASDDHEDKKAKKPAPSTKGTEPVVEPSTGYGGRETRSRARAKRGRDEIPDVDKVQIEQAATSKPPSKRANTSKSAATGKAQHKK